MAFDVIITNKITEELQNIIGYKVDKICQPNKNTVILGLYKAGNNLALLSCISSNNYRVHLTTHQYSNPTVAPNFCMLLRKHLIGFKIQKIYTHDLERIIFIDFENLDNPDKPIYKKLIIELMGKHSNIILTNENDIIIDSIRHTSTEENSQRDIYPTCRYILPNPNIYNRDLTLLEHNVHNLSFNTIYDKNGLPKDYVLSLNDRYNNSSDNYYNLNFFLDDFYFEKETFEIFNNRKNTIFNIVSNTYKKYQKRLENMNKKLLDCENMDKYKLYGELITANLYQISNKNINSITLHNYYDNNNLITIPLDERYSPSHNSKLYFKKYSKLKNALEIVNVQKQETLRDLNYIESVLFEIENASCLDDLILIEQEIYDFNNEVFNRSSQKYNKNSTKKSKLWNKSSSKNAKSQSNKTSNFHPLEFVIEDYKIYVGRNNKENDYLTTKFANKNDIWFHTQDIHGSHVILKTHLNEIIPDNILLEAAKLAALHSKAKSDKGILVDYCPISHVKKPSGSQPGFVIYKNHKTIKL